MPTNSDFFKRLTNSTNLTDVLIQVEDFMDGLDLYVFKNWIDGEVVQGPTISRYWVDITLQYPYEQMPDPSGGLRLLKHGVKVFYTKANQETARDIEDASDYRPERKGKPAMDVADIWLVDLKIPRRFIDELNDDQLELEADEAGIELDSVSDARDEDIDGSEEIVDDEAATEGDDMSDDVEDALKDL